MWKKIKAFCDDKLIWIALVTNGLGCFLVGWVVGHVMGGAGY